MSFWQTKTLAEMSFGEWESLCDGCGQCCLHKLEDEDNGQIAFTNVACDLLDVPTCSCSSYVDRFKKVPGCVDLRRQDFSKVKWLPITCAYRLLNEGKPLLDWHPLITGNRDSVHQAGISVAAYAVKEAQVDDFEDHIIAWMD